MIPTVMALFVHEVRGEEVMVGDCGRTKSIEHRSLLISKEVAN